MDSGDSSKDVAVRVGVIFTQKTGNEKNKLRLTLNEDENCVIYCQGESKECAFSFDAVVNHNSAQEKLYPELLLPLVPLVVSGYSWNVLVAGTHRSGKENILCGQVIVRQLIEDFFNELNKMTDGEWFTTVSFVQFYPDDTAVDLLYPQNRDLKPVTHPVLGIVIDNVCEIVVQTPGDAWKLYDEGRETQKATTGNLISRCSSLYSISAEKRLRSDSECAEYSLSRLQVFDLAGGAFRNDLNGISPLLKVLDQSESRSTPSDSLLPVVLTSALHGNCYNVLLYCIKPQGLVDEETPWALELAHRVRGLTTRVSPGHWSPQRTTHRLRTVIRELRNSIVLQGESGDDETRELAGLIKTLQVVKNQDWEKKREKSKENEEKRKSCAVKSSDVGTLSHGAPQLRDIQEKIRQLQEQLKKEMEEHLRDGKVTVDKNQERVGRIQELREAIREEQRKRKNADQGSGHLQHCNDQANDSCDKMSDAELEYSQALNRRRRLKEEHGDLIHKELLKMEQELEAEKDEGQAVEVRRLDREREILVLQLEALRREKAEAEKDLEAYHHRRIQEMDSLQAESLQVFRAFREVFEDQVETLEKRYRGLLLEVIQDAVYLSTRNQELEAENKQLEQALAKHRDALTVERGLRRAQQHHRETASL
ncbi:golgin subfamily A member 6-like protein 9 [Lepisosteus oculatus]|uniref:golgin subfamily A member 6-like protein 9 n=1 Tax=Lepisosteus oculatus TaxID=7918 RepID=UPI0035F52F8F